MLVFVLICHCNVILLPLSGWGVTDKMKEIDQGVIRYPRSVTKKEKSKEPKDQDQNRNRFTKPMSSPEITPSNPIYHDHRTTFRTRNTATNNHLCRPTMPTITPPYYSLLAIGFLQAQNQKLGSRLCDNYLGFRFVLGCDIRFKK